MKQKLFEFSVIISRSIVVAATSEAEARKVFGTWETAWEHNSDFGGVSDIELNDTREIPEGYDLDKLGDLAHEIANESTATQQITAPDPVQRS